MSDNTDIVDYIENVLGIKLLEYQKIFVKQAATHEKLYITMPPNVGRTDFRVLMTCLECILGEENKNE